MEARQMLPSQEESGSFCAPFQPLLERRRGMSSGVFVNAYERFRFGRIEHVCAHWRSR